jgi:hypothetical protein
MTSNPLCESRDPFAQKIERERQERWRAEVLAKHGPAPELSGAAKIAVNIFGGIFGVLMPLFFISFGVLGIVVLCAIFGA